MKKLNGKSFVLPAVIVMSLAFAPMLTGCSGNPIQGIIKNATGGQVDVGGAEVPKDFPKEIPLVSGAVISGTSIGNNDGKVWNVAIKVSASSAVNDITTQLTGAGFTAVGTSTTSDTGSSSIFTKDPYGILVLIAKADGGGFVANYTVTYTKPSS